MVRYPDDLVSQLPETLIVFRGPQITVAWAYDNRDRIAASEFIDSKVPDKDRASLSRMFKRMAEHGKITNPEKFKRVPGTDDLYEFKSFQTRVFAIREANCWFLLCGIIKKRNALPKSAIKRAEKIAQDHRRWMERKGLRK